MAITNGYEGALSELIASDAQWMLDSSPTEEADSTVSKSESLLHAAAELGSAAVIEVMADRSEINAQWGEWKATALHSTTPHDYAEAAEALLQKGADINAEDSFGSSALLLACARGSKNLVRVLLSRDADPNKGMRVAPRWTPLQVAAHSGRSDLVRLLLDAGAFVAASNKELGSPLHLAVGNMVKESQQAYYEVVTLLLDYNVDVNSQRSADGATPLHLVIKNDNLGIEKVIELLLRYGADVDKTDHDNKSPLFYAVQSQNKHTELLWNSASPWNQISKGVVSFLMDAAAKGMDARVRMLLEAGCDAEELDVFGRTARDVALKASVRRLLSIHEDVAQNDDEGVMCAFVRQDVQAGRDFRPYDLCTCEIAATAQLIAGILTCSIFAQIVIAGAGARDVK
ncbi:ankyrin repeat-containing domain protein [Hypoxylon argillaceum]|nr:ankyrin repeat-containing domain protein [Hypoxylon argillaceum]